MPGPFLFSHVGLSVPDIDAANKFYQEVLGFRSFTGGHVVTYNRSVNPDDVIFGIYKDVNIMKVTWLRAANSDSVGIELFEFVDPPYTGPANGNDFDYRRGGFYHIGLTTSDPEGLLEKVIAAGGKQIGSLIPGANGNKFLYFHDPWGNVIELLTSPYDTMFGWKGEAAA